MASPSPWLIRAHLPDSFDALKPGVFSHPVGEHLTAGAALPETASPPALKHCAIAFFEIAFWEGVYSPRGDVCTCEGMQFVFQWLFAALQPQRGFFPNFFLS